MKILALSATTCGRPLTIQKASRIRNLKSTKKKENENKLYHNFNFLVICQDQLSFCKRKSLVIFITSAYSNSYLLLFLKKNLLYWALVSDFSGTKILQDKKFQIPSRTLFEIRQIIFNFLMSCPFGHGMLQKFNNQRS